MTKKKKKNLFKYCSAQHDGNKIMTKSKKKKVRNENWKVNEEQAKNFFCHDMHKYVCM